MTIAQDIQGTHPAVPQLSLIHTTTVATLRKICVRGALIPQRCPVMDADLTYLFYGRPAYRPGPIDTTDRNKDSRPVCLIFQRNLLPNGVGTYPCDTGAHHEGRYSPHLDGFALEDLECSVVPTAEGRIVARYFADNERYFYGEELAYLSPPAVSSVAKSYFDLLAEEGRTNYDDRARTVEVMQDQEIDLTTALRGVLLPDFLISEPQIETWTKHCKSLGISFVYYRPQSQTCAAREVERRFPEIAKLQGIPQ